MKKKGYNLTTVFALPLCGQMRSFYEPYLINAYLRDDSADIEPEDSIFIVLKYRGDARFDNIEKILDSNDAISYDLYGGSYVVFVNKIKDCFINDFKLFKKGLYSKFSQPAKRAVKASSDKKSLISLVFDKSPKAKDHWEKKFNIPYSPASVNISSEMEAWPILNIEKETFYKERLDYNRIKEEERIT